MRMAAVCVIQLMLVLLVVQAVPFLPQITQGVKIGGIPSEVFWFRAVATSYVLRLNSRTLQVLTGLRFDCTQMLVCIHCIRAH